jgi:hypothetical protein
MAIVGFPKKTKSVPTLAVNVPPPDRSGFVNKPGGIYTLLREFPLV